jgi:hypothetical protein
MFYYWNFFFYEKREIFDHLVSSNPFWEKMYTENLFMCVIILSASCLIVK